MAGAPATTCVVATTGLVAPMPVPNKTIVSPGTAARVADGNPTSEPSSAIALTYFLPSAVLGANSAGLTASALTDTGVLSPLALVTTTFIAPVPMSFAASA